MLNKTILQGRLVATPEIKTSNTGINNTRFTVAWNERYKDNETTCFLVCKAWRQTADVVCSRFAKGQEIIVEGKLITEKWQHEGVTKSMIALYIDKVHFCGNKESKIKEDQEINGALSITDLAAEISDDEVPF